MRLIDADALVRRAIARYKKMMGTDIGHGMGIITSMITDSTTIDAVPVVRCKECANWNCFMNNPDGTLYGSCDLCGCSFRNEDDFCSYGERKDGDG